ncbi:mitochondrial carrier [Suillus paluster]|uniref:mitochondrial carrier n=1 Tax=Suillus paluster TaxID=48578 RepID=UPI001B87EDB2|nr:mitochondrial carrier [Suillus paluster]KAG1732214.1 mitochondrial carrier [Suillus paluster]
MLSFSDVIFVLGTLGLSLAILVPLAGTLVRFRAHYNPKGLQLDSEGGVQPHTGPVISSFFAMLRRVHRIEGWLGLYKGLMPSLLSSLVITFFLVIFLSDSNLRHGTYSAPDAGAVGILFYSIFAMLVSLPQVIITNRAITTPHKLPYLNAIYSLRVLLTPTERRKPWILYLTPGLLAVQVAHIAYVVLGLRTIRQLLLPGLANPGFPNRDEISPVKATIFLVIALLSTAILTPLEVIAIRLSIQRNHAAPEFNSISQEEDGDAEEATEYAGADEDVIGLRTEREPYIGLVDCAKRIIEEEGWSALYRAWWLTTLGSLSGALS